jgi:hypothetical protein
LSTAPVSGRRPSELDDPEWLQRRYLRDGDMSIALDLHVSRGTVIRARERLGIPSQPTGRRRGVSTAPLAAVQTAGDLIAARIGAQSSRSGPAPSKHMLAERFAALVDADTHGDQSAFRDALIEMAAGCGLVWDHLQRLEAA